MAHGGELTTTTLLNQHIPNGTLLVLMLTDKYSCHLDQGNVSLQQIETIRENQSTCRVVELSLNGYIYKSTFLPKAQRTLRDEERLYEPKYQEVGCETVSL